MEVKLTNYTVHLKDQMTWGDSEKIQSALMSGAKMQGKAQNANDVGFDFDASAMSEAKYVTMECMVQSITDENGKEFNFSRDWVNNLPVADGNKLYSEVDALTKKEGGGLQANSNES